MKNTKTQTLMAGIAALVSGLFPTNETDAPVAASRKLKDGSEIHFNGELAEGTEVFTDAEMTAAVADGEHTFEDESSMTVEGGKVTAMADAPIDEESDADKIARLEAENADLRAQVTTNEAETADMVASLEAANTALANVKSTWQPKARTTTVVAKVGGKAPEANAEPKTMQERVAAAKEKIKTNGAK